MKVILSNQCISLTGMLERGLGYHLEHRKNGFFAKRDTAGGKKTMKAYLWKVCGDEYDAQHGNA